MAAHYQRILMERKRLHTYVFDVAFSPCGNFFVACNNFGDLALFSLASALASDADEQSRKPLLTFKAQQGPIYSLISTDTFLISGGSTEISGWRWDDLLEKSTNPSWTFAPPSSYIEVPETNALVYEKESNVLYSGCGDNNIYSWDMETGVCKSTFEGHTDYVQSLVFSRSSNQCISGSEDGSVRFWDCRSSTMNNMIEPYKDKNLDRPKYGKWIGCLALDPDEEWMVCGGGPKLSVWHLRSPTCTSILNTPNSCQKKVLFHEDMVISSGSEPVVFHWQVNGELRTQVPCTPSSVYALKVNPSEKQVLLVGGSSAKIDAYINFGYKAFSFSFS